MNALPSRLCSFFTQVRVDTWQLMHFGHVHVQSATCLTAMDMQEFNRMVDGQLPDAVVAREYVLAFQRLAMPIMDSAQLASLNRTYWATMLLDPRHLATPTRERGVWHICSKCDEHGFFVDERSGKRVRSQDWRFRAAHVFRFIGWALAQAGHACSALWDESAPDALNMGGHVSKPCEPLPQPVHAVAR